MKKYLQGICVGAFLAGSLLIQGCAATVEAGGPYYDYDYYPDGDVYYYPHGHVYYWNEGGAWRSGERLPDRYAGHTQHSEQLHLHSQQPWTEHHVQERAAAQHHDEDHH